MWRRLVERLFEPVDIASIAVFRVCFGALMLWELSRYWRGGVIQYYASHTFFFPYYGFEWVKPWPGDGIYVHFAVLAILLGCITVGLLYRVSAALFFVGFAYVFLLDQALYLNHIYLIVLVSGILAVVPAHRAFSLDALLRPRLRASVLPAWTLGLLRFQIAVPYFFGGLSKLNSDWLHGEPMRGWLRGRVDLPLIGGLFDEEWVAYAFSYGGLCFDLLIAPALLWRRTRLPAFGVALCFHLFNSWFFHIGVFPWFMIAATALFFPPDYPRRLLRWMGMAAPPAAQTATEAAPARRRWVAAALCAYAAVQLLLPLRHYAYPGVVFWSGEGLYFGWHMRGSHTKSSLALFTLDPVTGERRPLDYRRFVSKRQSNSMSARPWMVHSFSRAWADRVEQATGQRLPVYAELRSSLNGRSSQRKIDPEVNLAEEPAGLGPARWILPLTEPLPAP